MFYRQNIFQTLQVSIAFMAELKKYLKDQEMLNEKKCFSLSNSQAIN